MGYYGKSIQIVQYFPIILKNSSIKMLVRQIVMIRQIELVLVFDKNAGEMLKADKGARFVKQKFDKNDGLQKIKNGLEPGLEKTKVDKKYKNRQKEWAG